jgi:formyl-CoA transferase
VVSSPISVGDQGKVEPRPAPGYGEHTRAALSDLGYTGLEIDALVAAGTALG